MPVWAIALCILVGGGVVVTVFVIVARSLERAGADAVRADRAEADAAVAKKQADIMLEQRSTDDAAARLDRGDF